MTRLSVYRHLREHFSLCVENDGNATDMQLECPPNAAAHCDMETRRQLTPIGDEVERKKAMAGAMLAFATYT